MKIFNFCLASVAVLFLAVSCGKEEDGMSGRKEVVGNDGYGLSAVTMDYDEVMGNLALSVSRAMCGNTEFRQLIHENALEQFDGDYDVLLKHVADDTVLADDETVVTRSADGTIAVKDLLSVYFPEEGTETRSSGTNIIEELQRLYPNLQISVPVHAEDWNPEEYVPVVAFLPEDYCDATVTEIPGYDAAGNFVWIDAINIPENPVIVVGLCERTDANGELLDGYNPEAVYPYQDNVAGDTRGWGVTAPAAPTNLAANRVTTGVALSWEHSGTANGFYIYRKAAKGGAYQKIGTVTGSNNKTYFDYNLISNEYYYYYVSAYSVGGTLTGQQIAESGQSNVVFVQAPAAPAALSSFTTHYSGKNVELRWNNDGDNSSRVVIEYMVPEHQSGYQRLITRSGGVNNYIYSPAYRGTKIMYRAYRENSIGNSDAVYDFIYPPYRNADASSPVYVKQIKFTDWSLERWPAGKPEFYLKVVGAADDGKTYEIQNQVEFNFDSKSNISQVFKDKKVVDWRCFSDQDWYSMITFCLEEYDLPNAAISFKISADIGVKIADALEVRTGAELGVQFSNKGEMCGNASIYYFDNPEQWVVFPNYGVQMLISEHGN